jgi:KDO2-lipid IV(A) lauroyltransferase
MRKPRFEDIAEYAALMPLVFTLRLLPARAALGLSAALGRFAFDVIGFRRGVVLANLSERLPPRREGSARGAAHAALGRACYAQFAMSMAEFARLPLVDARYVDACIKVEGTRYLDEALEEGRGAVLVTGHYGSWELMGRVLVMMGYPITFAVGVQRNPLVQNLMNNLRREAGIDLVEAASTLSLARAVRANRFVAMLSDQDAGPEGVFVDFMGAPASTPQGAARLALLTGAPVITGFIMRERAGRHRITLEPPIRPDPSMPREEAVTRITQRYTGTIEAYVKKRPDHWLWGHRRWKTRPG